MSALDPSAFLGKPPFHYGLGAALARAQAGAIQHVSDAIWKWRLASLRGSGAGQPHDDPYDSEALARQVLALAARHSGGAGLAAPTRGRFFAALEAELLALEPHFDHAPRILALTRAGISRRLGGLAHVVGWPSQFQPAALPAAGVCEPVSGREMIAAIWRDPGFLLRFAALASPSLLGLVHAARHLSAASIGRAARWRLSWALRMARDGVRPPPHAVGIASGPSMLFEDISPSPYGQERLARIMAMVGCGPFAKAWVLGSPELARLLSACQEVSIATHAFRVQHWPRGRFDLILAADVLQFAPNRAALGRAIFGLAEALAPDGVLVLAHDHQLTDDASQPGFDSDVRFGAQSIGEIAESAWPIALERELRTSHYTIARFRRADGAPVAAQRVQASTAPAPAAIACNFLAQGAMARRNVLRQRERTDCFPILRYQRITAEGFNGALSLAAFEAQLGFLRRHGFSALRLSDVLTAQETGRALAGRPVLLTFDDGFEDFIAVAACLERYGFSAVLCVSTDKIGLGADWEGPGGAPLLGRHALAGLHDAGIEIAALGGARCPLTALDGASMQAQMHRAFAELSAISGEHPLALAYPMGAHDPWVRAEAKAAGFRLGLTQRSGMGRLADDPMRLARWSVPSDAGLSDFGQFVLSRN